MKERDFALDQPASNEAGAQHGSEGERACRYLRDCWRPRRGRRSSPVLLRNFTGALVRARTWLGPIWAPYHVLRSPRSDQLVFFIFAKPKGPVLACIGLVTLLYFLGFFGIK